MKAVLRELAQAKRHYSKLPFFEFLRCESIAPRDRLAFFPAMAPFILAFSDLNRFVLRDEASRDPYQQLVNDHTEENDHHWPWYLEDLGKLGFDRTHSVAQVLRSWMRDDSVQNRMMASRLAQLIHGTSPIEKLLIVDAIEEAGNVLFDLTGKIAQRIQAEGGPELRYLGRLHVAREGDRPTQGMGQRILETISLTQLERVRCLGLSFHVFDLFADWSTELLAYAKNAITRRPVLQEPGTPLLQGRTA